MTIDFYESKLLGFILLSTKIEKQKWNLTDWKKQTFPGELIKLWLYVLKICQNHSKKIGLNLSCNKP